MDIKVVTGWYDFADVWLRDSSFVSLSNIENAFGLEEYTMFKSMVRYRLVLCLILVGVVAVGAIAAWNNPPTGTVTIREVPMFEGAQMGLPHQLGWESLSVFKIERHDNKDFVGYGIEIWKNGKQVGPTQWSTQFGGSDKPLYLTLSLRQHDNVYDVVSNMTSGGASTAIPTITTEGNYQKYDRYVKACAETVLRPVDKRDPISVPIYIYFRQPREEESYARWLRHYDGIDLSYLETADFAVLVRVKMKDGEY